VQCWGTPVGATETNLGEDDIATSVSCGSDFCCAVLESGQPKCWGANGLGQLGLSAEIAATLTAVGAGVKVTSLSCGNIFTCALLSTGQLMCWGGCLISRSTLICLLCILPPRGKAAQMGLADVAGRDG
jgi:alpha-tubulin suppressor-like RCC1 family protein